MSTPLVVVTGAGGFVGRQLVASLADRGLAVRACWRDRPVPAAPGVTPLRCDLATPDGAAAAVRDADVVIHLAARAHVLRERAADPEAAFRAANVGMTVRIAAAAAAAAVRRFVFLSSIGVHGDEALPHMPITEASPPRPVTAYARSKHAAEVALQRPGAARPAELVIVRPPLVYGPDAPGNLARLLRAVRRGVPLPFGGVHNQRSLVGVTALAELLVLAAVHTAAAGETFVAADARTVSTPEIVRALADGCGVRARLMPLPAAAIQLMRRVAGERPAFRGVYDSLVVHAGKARDRLGWQPVEDPLEGLRHAAAATAVAA